MGMVGQFPGMASQILTPRMPVNPMDKCTIVSVYPKVVDEVKHTIFPGRFKIEKGSPDNFSLLVVGPSSWWKEMEENQPYLEIPHSSIQVAESVIRDYCNGLFGCNMSTMMPGLFYIPGAYNKNTVVVYTDAFSGETFNQLLNTAIEKQKNYFVELVRLADIMWARSNGNPLTVSEDARLAASILKMDKPWMQDFKTVQLNPCKACGELINTNYPVCKHCHAIIDEDKAKAMQIKFAV